MSNLLSVSSIFGYIGYIIIAILVLLLMVLIHELGHYIAGKILKFKINEFSVGFGPKLLQKTKKDGEKISLRVFPLGGYCAFEGEDEEGNSSPNAFNNQKPWKRLIVLFSGAFFNFLSAIIFSFILLVSNGYDLMQVDKVAVNSINYGYLQSGDIIVGVDGNKIDFVKDKYIDVLVQTEIKECFLTDKSITSNYSYTFTKDGKQYYMQERDIVFNIIRDEERIDQNAKINVAYNADGKAVFWTWLNSEKETTEFKMSTYEYGVWDSLKQAIPFTCKWVWKVLVVFGQLITGKLSLTALGGPVTTIKTIATQTQTSFSYLFVMAPVIAVNLAVFNLLPIPALDGFQMIFVGIEGIRKKPVKRSIVNIVNNVGLMALLGFVIIIDVLQFILWVSVAWHLLFFLL